MAIGSVALEPFDAWLDNVSLAALSTRDTVKSSYDIARWTIANNIPGDFVECGVFGGAQCAAMARAIMDSDEYVVPRICASCHGTGKTSPFSSAAECEACGGVGRVPIPYTGRRVHLFDTFDGIPAPGEHDPEIEPQMVEAFQRETRCSLEDCKAHMREWNIPDELLVWHQGLFETTVPFAANYPTETRFPDGSVFRHPPLKRIAILRLDGDLYESTKVCLQYLYPLLSPGGWCIIDDFGLAGARKATIDYMKDQFGPVQWRKR